MKVKGPGKGFTLIELLLVVAIVGIIAIPVTTYFMSNYAAFHSENEKLDMQSEARQAMDEIMTALRSAEQSSINIKNEEGIEYLQMIIGSDTYAFYKDGSQIKKTVNTTVQGVLVRKVEAFSLSIADGGLVKVEMTLRGENNTDYLLDITNSHKIRN